MSSRLSAKTLALRLYQMTPSFFHALRFLSPGYYRGLRSARKFARHYAIARDRYRTDGMPFDPALPSVYDVGAHSIYPHKHGNPFSLDSTASEYVDRVRHAVHERFLIPANCYFFPRLTSDPRPELHTDALPEVQNGDIITAQLRDYEGIDGLSELCNSILSALERQVYGCYLIADKIYIYRNLVSRQQEQISWLWHYDNHPDEVVKVMIYLTDVDETTGPFEYLASSSTGRPLKMAPIPGLGRPFLDTRISPQQIARYTAQGFTPFKLTGPKGTTCLFSENIIHKANIAKTRHRDVLIIQIRPVTFRPSSYVSHQWTGSFQHLDVPPDPAYLSPIPKPRMASG